MFHKGNTRSSLEEDYNVRRFSLMSLKARLVLQGSICIFSTRENDGKAFWTKISSVNIMSNVHAAAT